MDIPKKSTWLVHRAGRAGRHGRDGASLLILTPEQEAYVGYVKQHEKLSMVEKRVKTVTELKGEQLREKIVGWASKDRELLEHGTAAYVSWLKAQTTHDAWIVCKIKELDLIGHAHAFGLLRLPKTKETLGRDTSTFKRSDIDTSTIPYKSTTVEAKRQEEKESGKKRDAYKEKEAKDPKLIVKKKINQKRKAAAEKAEAAKKAGSKRKASVDGEEKKTTKKTRKDTVEVEDDE